MLHEQLAALPTGAATVWAAVPVQRLGSDRARHACIIAHAYDNPPGRCLACPSLRVSVGLREGERGPDNARNNAYPSGASVKRQQQNAPPDSRYRGISSSWFSPTYTRTVRVAAGGA